MLSGNIKEIIKSNEYVNANINVFYNRKINVWSKDVNKRVKVFEVILKELQKQKFVNVSDGDNSAGEKEDLIQVLFYSSNKELYEKYNFPKELFWGDRILSKGDEELFNYLLSNIIENTTNEKIYGIFDDFDEKNSDFNEFFQEFENFFVKYKLTKDSKKPLIYVLTDDISIFENTVTYELLKKIYGLGISKKVFSFIGSNIDNNIDRLAFFSSSRITLIDNLSVDEIKVWNEYGKTGLGDISKLDGLNENEFLCLVGDLTRQDRDITPSPFIVAVKDIILQEPTKPIRQEISESRNSNVFTDNFSLLETKPSELVEYKYSLQEEKVKILSSFCDIKKTIVKDFKSILLDYVEFENIDSYDILSFANDNFMKLKNEFNYRMGKYVQREDFHRREVSIEKCFSLGRNLEISEYIKLKPMDWPVSYNWLVSNTMLLKTIVDLWNNQNDDNKITAYHFYKYSKEYRQKYGYTDEWSERDI